MGFKSSNFSQKKYTIPFPQSGDGATAADQMAALVGPEQMAALLGPSWKSRQPRMCQYCQRMFSNKFNLKQVRNRKKIYKNNLLEVKMKIFENFSIS